MGVAMGIARKQRDYGNRPSRYTRLTKILNGIPAIKLIGLFYRPGGALPTALRAPVTGTDEIALLAKPFLGLPVRLDQAFDGAVIISTPPDVVGSKTTSSFIDEGTLKALLMGCLRHLSQPILGFLSYYRRR